MCVLQKFLFLKKMSTRYNEILDKMKDFVDTEVLMINSPLDSACCSRTQAEIW